MDEIAEEFVREQPHLLDDRSVLMELEIHVVRVESLLDFAEAEGAGQNPQASLEIKHATAYHEAGHAAVCLLLGEPVDFVEILPTGGGFWEGLTRSRPQSRSAAASTCIAGPLVSFILNNPDLVDDVALIIEEVSAEAALEEIVHGDWCNFCDRLVGSDWEEREWTLDEGEAVYEAVQRTRDLVLEPASWALIERLAERLISASDEHDRGLGRLRSAELQALVQRRAPDDMIDTPPCPPQFERTPAEGDDEPGG